MSEIDAIAQAGLQTIVAAHGGVSVLYRGVTVTGLCVTRRQAVSATEWGYEVAPTSTVRVSAHDMELPGVGEPLLVDGRQVYVTAARTGCGVHVIDVTDVRPVIP